ncbi:MAG: efflux RND transporter permease subunit [Bacteroidales bacterium]|nr:efflux RND transporter permease subunit [Bacteroidales bacterium]
MKSDFFIDRPIFSTVISIIIVLIGFIGLFLLPVDQYPNIVPPVVKVSASYPGAGAETVSQAVATPIEQVLNGTPGMLYMESRSANNGSFSATITFDISTNADLAAVEVQNRVKDAESRLPAEVIQNGISVEKQASSKLMTITLKSSDPKFDEIYLSNYATLNVLDMLRRVNGVGQVSNIGSRYYAMQVKVRPEVLAAMGLTVQDITNAIKEQNRESAAGVLGQQPMEGIDITIPIVARGRLSSISEFEDIVIKANKDGSILRLRDVAEIALEAQSYTTESGINGENAAVLEIKMLPGMNAMEVSKNVKKAMDEISRNFPQGITYDIPFDMTEYISQSIKEVYKTLLEALVLVILVVFLSLQSWRATLIPAIAVPISLIGTFGVMLIFGFTLNTLTLLGLVLAIGTVVDDAIVVVESVDMLIHTEKLSPYQATKKAMNGLGGALIATSLVLCAVFVPVSFLSGITGLLYRQFTITIAVSVIISTIVALTLSPVMCSKFLKSFSANEKPKNLIFRTINKWLDKGTIFYGEMIRKSVVHSKKVYIGYGISILLIFVMMKFIPQSFIPAEDQGYFTVELELPEGASLERSREVTDRAIEHLMGFHDVEHILNVTGSSPRLGTSQSHGQITVIMKPWEEREEKDLSVFMEKVRKDLSQYPESKVYLSSPPVIPGLGSSGGFEMAIEAKGNMTYNDLKAATDTLLYYASQRKELSRVSSSMQNEIPQLYINVDRDMAKLMGVSVADIFTTMKTFTGSVYVNDFNLFNRVYRVYLQADAPYRAHRNNMNLYFVKGNGGKMIPITSLGTTTYTTGPGSIKRFNMYYASTITGEAASGYSSGQAMKVLEEIAREKLPKDIGIEWSGLSYQEKQQSGQTGFVILLAFLFVFLFLAAQYESWSIPIAVLLSLPVACLGAFFGITLFRLENNVYFQIGLVMLIGLAAKNAILIVEFAQTELEKGKSAIEAAVNAGILRFRPIVMTSLTFILGMLPLVLASGPGAQSRQSIGVGVFFGMMVAITIGILLVPFFFIWIHKCKEYIRNKKGGSNE